MALKAGNKTNKQDNKIITYCLKQENKKKAKPVRKRYSLKKAELKIRKRLTKVSIEKPADSEAFLQLSLIPQGVPSAMFYPQCPQYYSVTLNEWSPVLPIQCPLYGLQPIPILVNPVVSTQICPYQPMVAIPPVTMPNEVPVSPLVSVTNEFSLHTSNNVSPGTPLPNELPVFCEMSPIVVNLSNDYSNKRVSNEVELFGTPVLNNYSPFANEVTSNIQIQNEFSPMTFGYEYSPLTPMSDSFSPVQSMQIPNEYIPCYTTVSYEYSPVSTCSYESTLDTFECELPISEPDQKLQYLESIENPLEYYLTLPKDLFPTARMMPIDPNPIIDEFCKASNVDDHSWLLDLEFGIPKTPVTRRIAAYNVKLNSIQCKNTPEAIHPGFESCDKDLKRAIVFYYDCVISNWYRGYMAISSDQSVENFQSWLHLPMQVLGMCWP